MKTYIITDSMNIGHGEFRSIREAIQFINENYPNEKMDMWRYENGKYTRVIYK